MHTETAVALNQRITFANDRPFVLIGGMNVIEDHAVLFDVAQTLIEITHKLGLAFVFKTSFDKANRTSARSYRGPGLDKGLMVLAEIKQRFAVPILTDVHEAWQAAPVAEVADIIQLPAFLARQTDLITAMALTGAVVNVKKPQFLAPAEMRHILAKFADNGSRRVLLCERGSCFGYNNLVVDMLGLDQMKAIAPVIFDVTHALQMPGGRQDSADGRAHQCAALSRAGVAVGIAGLFLETHPDPARALCDGPSAIALADVEPLLRQLQRIDAAVKTPGAP